MHTVESPTARHLHLSQWECFERFRTPCHGAHLDMHKVRAVALRSDKQVVETEWGRSGSATRASLVGSRNATNCSVDTVYMLVQIHL